MFFFSVLAVKLLVTAWAVAWGLIIFGSKEYDKYIYQDRVASDEGHADNILIMY